MADTAIIVPDGFNPLQEIVTGLEPFDRASNAVVVSAAEIDVIHG